MYLNEAQEKQFREIRRALDGYVGEIAGIPEKINDNLSIIRPWEAGSAENPVTYTADVDVRMHGNIPYTCCQTHTHHGEPGWEPGPESSLWYQTHGTTPETARPFVQPKGAHDMYSENEYIIWTDGSTMRAKMDTTYSPDAYPQAWERYEV